MRILPALGLTEAVLNLDPRLRRFIYTRAHGKLIVTLDPDARRFEPARYLAKFLGRQVDRPLLKVPGFSRPISPAENAMLPHITGCLEGLRQEKALPLDLGREFFETDFGEIVERVDRELEGNVRMWAMAHTKIDEAICWVQTVTTPKRTEWIVRAEPAQRLEFKIAGLKRPAYRAGMGIGRAGCAWFAYDPKLFGLGEDHPRLGVYLQSHALRRVFERLSEPAAHGVLFFLLTAALANPQISRMESGEFLLAVDSPHGRLGYFVGSLTRGCFLLRTFLFITMAGTPEHETLTRRLRIGRRDVQYMKLDDMATFMKSDLADDAELVAILRDCGLGHLLELRKLFHGDIETGHASFMRTYLGLPKVGTTTQQSEAGLPPPPMAAAA